MYTYIYMYTDPKPFCVLIFCVIIVVSWFAYGITDGIPKSRENRGEFREAKQRGALTPTMGIY